jgi:hypothetical protein
MNVQRAAVAQVLRKGTIRRSDMNYPPWKCADRSRTAIGILYTVPNFFPGSRRSGVHVSDQG